jgi:FKBP-type peptidyl-prolyl cis-trans isomerase 2
MKLEKNDFIEIEFTARVKNTDEVFDSNIKEDLEKITKGAENKPIAKPFIYSIGNDMFLKGIDDYLINNSLELGKEFSIELAPEDAFGKRNPELVKIIPLKVFHEQNINPVQGAMFNMDNMIVRIISVSGGRVMTDFNNPLSGKDVTYRIKILRKVDKLNERIDSLMEFLFKRKFPFEIDNEKKIIFVKVDKQMEQFVEMFRDKFREILGMDLEIKKVDKGSKDEDKKENNTPEK